MFNRLVKLRILGYIPDTILDIGAHKGLWMSECKQIYPTSSYYLFEAIPYDELDRLQKNDPNIHIFQTILNDKPGTVDWYEKRNTGDSMFKELSHHFKDVLPIKKEATVLSSWIDPHIDKMKNVLIKIDCQGAEIPILKGAGKVLEKTDFIILEIPFLGKYNEGVPSFLEHIQYMDSIGFVPFDILEFHEQKEFQQNIHIILQIDMIFISKNHKFLSDFQQSLLSK